MLKFILFSLFLMPFSYFVCWWLAHFSLFILNFYFYLMETNIFVI